MWPDMTERDAGLSAPHQLNCSSNLSPQNQPRTNRLTSWWYILIFFRFCSSWDRVCCMLGWPWILHVAKGDLESVSPAPTSWMLGLQAWTTVPDLCNDGHWMQGFVHAKQVTTWTQCPHLWLVSTWGSLASLSHSGFLFHIALECTNLCFWVGNSIFLPRAGVTSHLLSWSQVKFPSHQLHVAPTPPAEE